MNVGLIVSGGGGKGAYQLGALKAINEYFSRDDFAVVSAASIGLVNTFAYFSDRLDYAINMWVSINNKSKNSSNKSSKKILVTSVVKSQVFQQSIEDIIQNSSLNCKNLYFPLLNIRNRELTYFNLCDEHDEAKMKSLICASITIPIMNRSVLIDGKYYMDGAVAETMPLKPFENFENLDYIICLYFDKKDKNFIKFQNKPNTYVIPICFDDDTRVLNAVSLSSKNIDLMIKKGYVTAKRVFHELFKKGISDIEYIREQINNKLHHKDIKQKKISVTTGLRYLNTLVKSILKK